MIAPAVYLGSTDLEMSSPTRQNKRRRTALTQAGDAPSAAVTSDCKPLRAPGTVALGLPGHAATHSATAGEPYKRKRQDTGLCKPQPSPPIAGGYQQIQSIPTGRSGASQQLHINETCLAVYHRPTYRADLAKRGYLVRNSLGCGSYSKVKKALNSRRNFELAAVKIVDRIRAPRDYQEKFMPRELALWPLLSHPNLIRFTDCFEDSSRVYMVLEYADGGDALHYVQSTGALPEDQARLWTAQIVSAVAYMHQLGVAHRDLKLENLLLTGDLSAIKICDFGFVRQIQPMAGGDLSQTFCGSKAYAAPEILQGRPYDPMKADVWAIGVIIYIFVTGKMPFDETKGTKSVVEEQRTLQLKWLLHRRPGALCQSLIRRTFTWDFADRPAVQIVLNDQWITDPLLPSPVEPDSSSLAIDCLNESVPLLDDITPMED